MNLVKEFMTLFRGLERAHGSYKLGEINKAKNKVEGKAFTILEPVTDALWEAHLKGGQGLGIIPIMDNAKVWFAAIDVDTYPIDLAELEKKIKKLKLPLIVCRTKSGGAHLYLFGREPLSAPLVRECMTEWAVVLGHPGVEIFPKQDNLASEKDVGNWINMPYFKASKTNRYAIKEGARLTAEEFITYAKRKRITEEKLQSAQIEIEGPLEGGPPCINTLVTGGMQEGGRNNVLINLGVYCRERWADDWEEKVVEMNEEHMDPPLPDAEVRVVIQSLNRKDYYYTCNAEPMKSLCNKKACLKAKYGVGDSDHSPAPFTIGEITKITTDPPTWVIDVNGKRIEMTTKEMAQQPLFAIKCAESINRLLPRIKENKFRKIIDDRLANCHIVEAPDDAGPAGTFWHYLQQWCTGPAQTDQKEDLLTGKIWTDDGKHYFQSAALMRYLDQQRVRGLDERKVWGYIQRNTHGHKVFKIKGVSVKTWWVEEFEKPDSDMKVPRAEEEL